MSTNNGFWARQTTRQKVVLASALALILAVGGVGVVAWLLPDRQDDTALTLPTAPEEGDAEGEDSIADEVEGPATTVRGSRDATGLKFEIDDMGMTVIPETDNPIEAAAAAVSAMYTFDSTKMPFWNQWTTELYERIGQPSPDYVGTTLLGKNGLVPSKEVMGPNLEGSSQWELRKESTYLAWSNIGMKWEAQPYEIWVNDEIKTIDPSLGNVDKIVATLEAEGIELPGTYTLVFVTVDVKHTDPKGNVEEIEHRTTFGVGVYCDVPEDGGLCGVHATLKIPTALQNAG